METYILNPMTISQKLKAMMLLLLYFMILLTRSDANQNQKVHCVFIHGAGTIPSERGYQDGVYRDVQNLPQGLQNYWGDVRLWTETTNVKRPICTSYAFTYLDTVHNSWKDENLNKHACEALKHEYERIENPTTRVFLHSMGNLIFFNALKTKTCKITDPRTTNVYSFGGPFLGSDMVKVAEDACKTKKILQVVHKIGKEMGLNEKLDIAINSNLTPWGGAIKSRLLEKWKDPEVQSEIGKICDVKTGKLTTAFKSLGNFAENKDFEILSLAQTYTKGAICGYKIGEDDFFTKLLSKAVLDKFHKSPFHDGVVHVKSCTAFNPIRKLWGTEYTNDFLLAQFHHNEIIGRTGEPKILKWLEQRE